jgi:Flp pilus assembly protein TadD
MAQKANIENARGSLRDKDYDKALEYINKAIADPSTKDDPRAWFVKGNIYMDMQADPKYAANSPYREAATAFIQANQLKANYEKETITQALLQSAYNFYNDAAKAYNQKEYEAAISYAANLSKIHDLDGGKRYAGRKDFDTVNIQGKQIAAFSAFYGNKFEVAVPMLNELKDNPIVGSPNMYLLLADSYKKQGKDAEYLAIMKAASEKYPDNTNVRNEMLNYYIKSGQTDIMLKEMEDAVAKDPNNADYLYNLAVIYNGIAFPKDGSGKDLPKPANYAELVGKAEATYLKALAISPDHVDYNYNTGALYYNQATEVNNDMNKITGNTPKEVKQFEDLKVKRDGIFDKAKPYLEKTVSVLDPKSSLTADEKFTYQSALTALRQIYAMQNDLKKASELKAKLEASRSK